MSKIIFLFQKLISKHLTATVEMRILRGCSSISILCCILTTLRRTRAHAHTMREYWRKSGKKRGKTNNLRVLDANIAAEDYNQSGGHGGV